MQIEQFQHFHTVQLVEGLNFDFAGVRNAIIVIDDQLEDLMKRENAQQLFTRYSHHQSVSLITLSQNLYPRGKISKDIRLNVHYFIIMKSFTLKGQVKTLGHQLFPDNARFLTDAYRKGTSVNFGYLVIVLHPSWEDELRVNSHIFSNEYLSVYMPDNGKI